MPYGAKADVKPILGIGAADTTYDTELDECLTSAYNRSTVSINLMDLAFHSLPRTKTLKIMKGTSRRGFFDCAETLMKLKKHFRSP